MGKMEPKSLLNSDWKGITIRGGNKTKCIAKNVYYNSDSTSTKTISDLFNHFLKSGKNEFESLIMSLLVKYGVTSVKLRGKTLIFKLEDNRSVKVRLTTNSIVNNYEEIIRMVVQNYLKTRRFAINKMLENKSGDIIFNSSHEESGIHFENGIYYFNLMGERGEVFGIDDNTLEKDIINTIIDDYDGMIDYDKVYEIININPNNYEPGNYEKVLFKISLTIGEKNVSVISPDDDLEMMLKEKVDDHNEAIENLSKGVSYVKKEDKKGV